MFDNVFQGAGIVLCIGGILVLVVGFLAFRALFGSRNKRGAGAQDDSMWNRRGSERPRYDDDQIESRGGMGGAPPGGRKPSRPFSTSSRDQGDRSPSSRSTSSRPRRDRGPDRNRDDDDVQSRGGFGS